MQCILLCSIVEVKCPLSLAEASPDMGTCNFKILKLDWHPLLHLQVTWWRLGLENFWKHKKWGQHLLEIFNIFVLKRKRIFTNFRILKHLALTCMGNFGILQNTVSSLCPSSPSPPLPLFFPHFIYMSVAFCWGHSI